jgi:DNA-directed RNA polymerase subunit F
MQSERDWGFVNKTLDAYTSFKKEDVKNMIGELKALGEKPININEIAHIVESKISDPALAETFSININDKMKNGKIDFEEVEVYLNTYALLDKEGINKIVNELEKLTAEQSLNNVSLIEVLNKYFSPDGFSKEKQIFLSGLTTLSDICIPMHVQAPSETRALSLISAGRRNAENFTSYSRAVQDFNWTEFYSVFNGEAYFEWFREQLFQVADVVLIDSRTGVSEMCCYPPPCRCNSHSYCTQSAKPYRHGKHAKVVYQRRFNQKKGQEFTNCSNSFKG